MKSDAHQNQTYSDIDARAFAREGMKLAGGYLLEQLVSTGGFGAFYKATDSLGEPIGVKVLHTSCEDNEAAANRLAREFEVSRRIVHRGLARISHFGIAPDDCPFIATEFFRGETLEMMRHRHRGVLPLRQIMLIGYYVAGILEAVHAAGVIHRDIKTENIMYTPDGIKLIDFDIAHVPRLAPSSSCVSGPIDNPRGFHGTIQFASPEQALCEWERVDARSDVYSLGATMSLLLSGLHVHDTDDVAELFWLTQRVPACSLRDRTPRVPPPIIDVVDAMLAFEPARRPADAHTVRRLLAATFKHIPT